MLLFYRVTNHCLALNTVEDVLAVGFKLEAYFVRDNLFVLSGNDHTNCTPSVSNFILLDCMYEFLWLFFVVVFSAFQCVMLMYYVYVPNNKISRGIC